MKEIVRKSRFKGGCPNSPPKLGGGREAPGWFHCRNVSAQEPPRLRRLRRLRGIFLLAQPPLLT